MNILYIYTLIILVKKNCNICKVDLWRNMDHFDLSNIYQCTKCLQNYICNKCQNFFNENEALNHKNQCIPMKVNKFIGYIYIDIFRIRKRIKTLKYRIILIS